MGIDMIVVVTRNTPFFFSQDELRCHLNQQQLHFNDVDEALPKMDS